MKIRSQVKFAAIGLLIASVLILPATLFTRDWKLLRERNANAHAINQYGRAAYLLNDLIAIGRLSFEKSRIERIGKQPYINFLSSISKKIELQKSPLISDKNIIYIQLESIDGFMPTAKIGSQAAMPFLDSLKKKGVYFEHVVDNTSAGRTTDAEFLTLTSLPPVYGQPVYVFQDLSKVPSLPRILRQNGYKSYAFHGFDGGFWNRANAHRALGFDYAFYREDLNSNETIGWGISDSSVLLQALDILEGAKKPIFAHIILLTNHHPYDHVGNYFGKASDDIMENHLRSLRYVDDSLRAFFTKLEELPLSQNTIIAVFGDHDSGLSSDLKSRFSPDFPIPDSVPLLILGLEDQPHTRSKIAGLQDLPVIVLNSLGIQAPITFTGNPLKSNDATLNPSEGSISFRDDSVRISPPPVDLDTLAKIAILSPSSLISD